MVKEIMAEEKKGIFTFFMEDILNIGALFEAGKIILILIVSTMAIHYWLQLVSELGNIVAKGILYSVTILIPIYIVKISLEKISGDKE